ncbi:dnaJ homolog subfamily C member 12-like [Mytilus galloprovincialis]|uniref:dnaJ homolog subfamily C member 12-like n=1 Tax=Mytilus galloprovincialis TaxID=29158 RepID=UPI003F7B8A6B
MEAIFNYEPDEEEDFYKILGCNEHSNTVQITTEYKARVLSCHPDKHPGDESKDKQFRLLQQAKDVLCDEEKRKRYDQWKNGGISMSFSQWCSLRDSVHTSMHWGSVKTKPMIEHDKPETTQHNLRKSDFDNVTISTHQDWNRDEPSEMLRKFRNYQI